VLLIYIQTDQAKSHNFFKKLESKLPPTLSVALNMRQAYGRGKMQSGSSYEEACAFVNLSRTHIRTKLETNNGLGGMRADL